MEADEVQASHLPESSFQKNPWYELENERRYHDEPASRRKVLEHAARLDPDFVLKDSVDANNGAPVVDRNGNVLGGNGRAMSIRQAYHTGGERAEAYRAALRDRAEELGLDPADVDAMQRPMLVRRLDKAHSHAERQALVTAMNDTFTDSKSARASGKTRGDRLSGRGLGMLAEGLKEAETLRQYFDEPESAAVVEQFIRDGVIQATERNAYVGADGLLNPDGKRVVEEALRGRIARNYDALAKLPADLVGKLDAAIPHILVAEGVGNPWNITEHVRDAVDMLAAFKGSGEKDPNIWLQQLDMLTGKTPKEEASPQAIVVFQNALREKKSGFVGMFAAYAAQAGISPEAGGLPGLGRSQAEAFAAAMGEEKEAPAPKPVERKAGDTEKSQSASETEKPRREEERKAKASGKARAPHPKEGSEKKIAATSIEDFGEKIGGARKDLWKKFRDDFQALDTDTLLNEATEKVFPAPDYNALLGKGVDEKAVACLHALRDYLVEVKKKAGSKHGKLYRKDVESVKTCLQDVLFCLEDETALSKVISALEAAAEFKNVARVAELYQTVGHGQSLAGIRVVSASYSMFNGKEYSPPKVFWTVEREAKKTAFSNWPKTLAWGETKEEAIAAFKKAYADFAKEDRGKKKDVSFVVTVDRFTRSKFSISKKFGSRYVNVAGPFVSAAEARAYAREHHDELVEKLEKMKEVPSERRESNEPRVGVDHRDGRDVTPEMFSDAFGFRGVEFGNWVEGDRRQANLNESYDALMDLAGILGVSPKALSLNGELGLAFGARGKGGKNSPAAHYESGAVAINLTKKSGAGSLAHEWMHALDNYFSRMSDGGAGGYLSNAYDVSASSRGQEYSYSRSGVRKAIVDAWGQVKKAIDQSEMKQRSATLDTTRAKPYWSTDIEMVARAFEAYIIAKLQDQNAANDYLANIVSEDAWGATALKEQGYPYPTQSEMAAIRSAFDKLFQTVEERKTDKGVALASLRKEPRRASDDTPVTVVEVEPGIVPEFAKVQDLVAWLKEYFAERKTITIKSTGKEVSFTNRGLRESAKRRGDAQRKAYAGLDRLVEEAVYDGFEEGDARHPHVAGQEVYYAAMRLGDKLYAVKFKLDLPLHEDSLHYKDHKVTEIEIAPVLSAAKLTDSDKSQPGASAIRAVNVGVLRGSVKPSRLENGTLSAIVPGEYLPKARRGLRPVKASAVRRVADSLGRKAARAAQTEVVQSFDELPARLREEYGDKARAVEGVYDPATDKVWLVADNLTSLERAADVWAHEQVVHHGLRGLVSEDERKRLLNRLWLSLGGMGNEGIREVAERYGVNPRGDTAARQQVMEEYLAGMAEKKRGALLSPREESLWRRIVAAVREAWAKLVRAVGGRDTAMGKADVDGLLSALGRYVMIGRPEGGREENAAGALAFASVGEDREAVGRAAWEQVRKDTEAWGRQLEEFAAGKGGSPRDRLQVGHTPDVLIRLGAKALPMEMTRGNVRKVLDKHGVPLDVLRQLPGHLADPLMVFKSATMADAYVVLTEMRRNDENLVAAVHFDVEAGRMRINDIASIHDRSTTRDTGEKVPGWVWVKNQIAAGNLRYHDKTRSSRWFRELSGLQLSGVMNRESYRGVKILTEKDVVKPVRPEAEKPLASLAGAADRVAEKIGKPKKRALSGISAEELNDNPALAGVLEKIGVARPTLAEKWENVKDTWKTTLEQGLFDRFASIKEYSETGYKMARMSTGLGSQLRAIMEFGAPVWRDDAMAVEGKGLREIFDPVAGELDRFLHWMVGRRASRLMEEGRENLLTKRDIAALLDLADGKTADGKERRAEYGKVFGELAAFKGKVLDFAQAGGVIDPVGRAVWENADYIPFYRVQERMDGVSTRGPRNGKGMVGQNAGIRELKGGLDNLGDPLENLLRNFAHLIDAAQKNKAALQVFADLHKAGMAEQLTSDRVKVMVQEDSAVLADALEAENLLSGLSAEQRQSLLSVFAIRRDVDASRSKNGGVVYARYQGRPYLFKVTDPLLYRALTGMNDRGDTSGVMRFGRKIKRVLTTGVTIMPDFMVRNFLRDSVHSWVVEHKSGLKPLTGSVQGLRATLAMDEDTRQLFASGATFMGNGYRLGNDPEAGRLELERMLKKSRMDKEGFFKSLLDDPRKIASALTLAWEKYESLGGASENAVRHEIYARLRKQGYSHLDASFAARDIMDFSMRGEFAFIRTLTDLVPFLGARLTGLHRLGQGALENPRAFAVKGGMVALAAVGLFLANLTRHKDEWDELEDWDKDSYFHFWIDGRHFRLPKPFEIGFLFGTIPERMAEQAVTDAPSGVFWGRVFRGIADQLAMDPMPQAVKPIFEDIANRDSFRGTPIVGQALAGRLPTEQHTARTTMTARMFADAMDALLSPVFGKSSDTGVDALRSPVRLEHLINGYFGGLGSTVLGLSDRAIRWLRDDPALPSARGPEDWPLVGAFYRGNADTVGRTKFEGELYDAMREADELAASLKLLRETGDTEAEARLREEMGERGARMQRDRKALNRLRRDFARFNRMMDAVYRDRTMSSSQKRLRLDELQRKKNELARREWGRHREAVRER